MKRRFQILIAFSLLAVLLAPGFASAASLADQIAALLAQISQLQTQLTAQGGATASTAYTFARDLTVGSKGNDVTALQGFLHDKGYLSVAPTGYFGSLTKAAVAAWQTASGISPTAGYFGSKSRAAYAAAIPAPTPPVAAAPIPVTPTPTSIAPTSTVTVPPVVTPSSTPTSTAVVPPPAPTSTAIVVSAPSVAVGDATNVGTNTAVLHATVSANGAATTAWFEYGQSVAFGRMTPSQTFGADAVSSTLSMTIAGLAQGSLCYVRTVAQNAQGTAASDPRSFKMQLLQTNPNAPAVITTEATNITPTSAALNGQVNPNYVETTAWFEYGTDPLSMTNKTPAQSMGGSSYYISLTSATVTGLTTGTPYYYRTVASSSISVNYGDTVTFTPR